MRLAASPLVGLGADAPRGARPAEAFAKAGSWGHRGRYRGPNRINAITITSTSCGIDSTVSESYPSPRQYLRTRKPGTREKSFTFLVTSGASSSVAAVAISRSMAATAFPPRKVAAARRA